MADKKKKWVKAVTEDMDKGAFRKKAEAAGKSTAAYAREHAGDSGKLRRQARLAETLMSMSKSHKKKLASDKTIRNTMYGKKD